MKIQEIMKSSVVPSAQVEALQNIIYTNNWLLERHAEFFKKFGITPQQFNALRILRGQHPNPATIKLIRERMLVKLSDTSRLVDRLLKNGWVNRSGSLKDARSVDVVISEKGLELLQKIDTEMHQLDAIMNKLSVDELKQISLLLEKLRD